MKLGHTTPKNILDTSLHDKLSTIEHFSEDDWYKNEHFRRGCQTIFLNDRPELSTILSTQQLAVTQRVKLFSTNIDDFY